MKIEIWVNGERQTLQIQPWETLADILRNRLLLTGTKIACNRASCGACTVILNGKTVLACHLLAVQANGCHITTIEGIGRTELHPIQKQFIKHDATQCGFCTPGMIVAIKPLLDQQKDISREDIVQAISGNLCRCGAYPKIIQAALEASEEQ